MSDLIERQAAIDLLEKWSGGYDYIETEKESAIKEFQKLPSAQEKLDENDMPEQGDSAKFGVKTGETCTDCISRQAAIDAVKDLPDCVNGFSDTYDKARIIAVLEDVPSAQPEHHAENLLTYAHDMGVTLEQAEKELRVAQPERKKGRWIDETVVSGSTSGGTTILKQYRCSICGNLFGRVDDKYCGRCGARMMEVEYETD